MTGTPKEAGKMKNASQLDNIDGLILPDGESTAIGKLLNEHNMIIPLRDKIKKRN